MIISIIAAFDESFGIGFQGKLPWSLPSDLKRFKQLTMGHAVLMGRKTYESIGRPLPGRTMLIVSRKADFSTPGCQVVPSLEAGLEKARQAGENELFVIGGGQLYSQVLPFCGRLYITRVRAKVDADVFFPPIDFSKWKLINRMEQEQDKDHNYSYVFEIYDRL